MIDNTYDDVIRLYKDIEQLVDLLKGKIWKWESIIKKSRIISHISMIETQSSHLKTHGMGKLTEEFPDIVELTCNTMTITLIEKLLPALEENIQEFEAMLLPIQDIDIQINRVELEIESSLIDNSEYNIDGIKKAFTDIMEEMRSIIDGISMDFNLRTRIYEMWQTLSEDALISTSYVTAWIFSGYIKSVKPLELLCENLISEIDTCFNNDISNISRSVIENTPGHPIDKR